MPRIFPVTRQQREALFRVFQRDFPSWVTPMRRLTKDHDGRGRHVRVPTFQWRHFRSKVMPMFGCDGAITIHWHGMWLAIERDGYVHS